MANLEAVKSWLGTGSINIFGRPLAGKDTQCHELAKLLNARVLSGGEILRQSAPAELMKDTNAGKLFPTEEYIKIVTPYLGKAEFAGRPLILSSVGRWHGEEPGVIGAAEASNHPIKAVIYLIIDESTAENRHENIGASRGARVDDAPELLKQRFQEFREKTLPVIEFYRDKGLLIEVEASGTTEVITNEILTRLEALA